MFIFTFGIWMRFGFEKKMEWAMACRAGCIRQQHCRMWTRARSRAHESLIVSIEIIFFYFRWLFNCKMLTCKQHWGLIYRSNAFYDSCHTFHFTFLLSPSQLHLFHMIVWVDGMLFIRFVSVLTQFYITHLFINFVFVTISYYLFFCASLMMAKQLQFFFFYFHFSLSLSH